MSFNRGAVVSVHYRDRAWDIKLNSAVNTACLERDTATLALELQAALNLSTPPVGLRLRVAPGAQAVICPLSAVIACPSYIATAYQGMSWFPLLEGGGDDHQEAPPNAPPATPQTQLPAPPSDDPLLPPPLGSPLEHELSFLATGGGSTASPSEGCGRPLTAPPGDRTRGMTRPRPGRREGLGRPMSATPSDKSFGMRWIRPGKSEGFGRPVTALPSDHSHSGSPAWGSPHGFQCEETAATTPEDAGARRPATAPALWRQPSSNLSGSRNDNGAFGERFGRGGSAEANEGTGGVAAAHHRLMPDGGGPGEHGRAVGGDVDWGWCGVGPARECWA
ncbi:unnamed protein product [Ectocarpus sp. CCAP 1310/34]|nr:unnamed protein product [Ectocarpus sp. CCAP 1310/34]